MNNSPINGIAGLTTKQYLRAFDINHSAEDVAIRITIYDLGGDLRMLRFEQDDYSAAAEWMDLRLQGLTPAARLARFLTY